MVDGNEFILCVREERERQRERKVTVYERKGRREGMKGEQREGRRGEGRRERWRERRRKKRKEER